MSRIWAVPAEASCSVRSVAAMSRSWAAPSEVSWEARTGARTEAVLSRIWAVRAGAPVSRIWPLGAESDMSRAVAGAKLEAELDAAMSRDELAPRSTVAVYWVELAVSAVSPMASLVP